MAAATVDAQGTIDLLALGNYKATIDLLITGAIGHHKRVDLIAEGNLGQILNSIAMATSSVPEGLGLQSSANAGLAGQMAALTATVANAMQLIKGGGVTPPTTV